MKHLQKILLLLLMCLPLQVLAQQGNDVKFGTARIVLHCDLPVDSLNVTLLFRNIFTETERTHHYRISAQDSTLLDIPVLLKQTVSYLNVTDDSLSYFNGWVGLNQNVPLQVHLKGTDLQHTEARLEGGMGFTTKDAENLVRAFIKFVDEKKYAPREDYADWHKYLRVEMDSLYALRLGGAMKNYILSTKARTWLTNVMTTYYLGGRVMSYQQDAQRFYQLTVPAPPLDYYTFLKRFNLSRLVMHSDAMGLIVFLRFFLQAPAFQIPPIGDTKIAAWRTGIQTRLTATVGELPAHFLDMLSAVAYLQQLEQAQPLTAAQKSNIQAYYKNDLGRFLLQENDGLVRSLSVKRESRQCEVPRESDMPMLDAILQNYPGQPVVVDLWNTWCGPCMQAHKLVAPIKGNPEFSNIAFVYIADDSSSKGMWEGTIPDITGDHYFLTEKEAAKLRKKVDASGIPFYLFYDAHHQLKSSSLGFPGPVEFQRRLRSLK